VRFRNDSSSVITVNDLSQRVGPNEEFDFPGYDKAVHGPVAGCTPLDDPAEPEAPAGDPPTATDPQEPATAEEPLS
jgi:hypothetical protein